MFLSPFPPTADASCFRCRLANASATSFAAATADGLILVGFGPPPPPPPAPPPTPTLANVEFRVEIFCASSVEASVTPTCDLPTRRSATLPLGVEVPETEAYSPDSVRRCVSLGDTLLSGRGGVAATHRTPAAFAATSLPQKASARVQSAKAASAPRCAASATRIEVVDASANRSFTRDTCARLNISGRCTRTS